MRQNYKGIELIIEIQKIANSIGYIYNEKDRFVHLLIFNKMGVTTLKQKELIKKGCNRYDKHDYLCLLDTSREVFFGFMNYLG